MASSRHMRRSRRASPAENTTPNNVLLQNQALFEGNNDDMSEEWIEPPLRPPAPSFEDYKGLERHGVLEHMAPLGTFPNSKVRARLKQHEPPRRAAHLKNGELRTAREEVNTPEPTPPVITRRSEPRKSEDNSIKTPSSRERDEDQDYTPTLKSTTRMNTVRTGSMHAALQGPPSSRTIQGRLKLKEIVDSAVIRSDELGDPVLGNAVKELYEESLRNATVADLLDAVLTQKPSPEQKADFQSRIRAARKKHRRRSNDQVSAPNVVATSPTAKSARSSVTRHLDSTNNSSHLLATISHPHILNHDSLKQPSENMETNGAAPNEERPPKRVKRSRSASSDSSLSSLDSAVEEEPPPTADSFQVSNGKAHQSTTQLPNGPRLGTFPIRPTDPSTRKSTSLHANSDALADGVAIKKREEMRQKYNQYVGIQESAIRSSPKPLLSPRPTPPVTSLAERNQKGRLRNGSSHRRKRIDYEGLDSPASSSFGELLIPPPLGASRGATPNHLGRPSKALRKAARIKMS